MSKKDLKQLDNQVRNQKKNKNGKFENIKEFVQKTIKNEQRMGYHV